MSAVDFAAWAQPDLVLTLGARTFPVRPPSVDDSAKLIALAVRGEVELGIAEGPVPDELQQLIDAIGPDEHPALGAAYDEMKDAGVSPVTIDRMAYYAIFYWARGKEYADWIGAALFSPRDVTADGGDAPRKASSGRKTSRRTGSVSPTKTAGTPTTGPSRTT